MIVTGSEMATKLRSTVGAESDTNLTAPELYKALTSGVADTWNTLLSLGIGTEGVKKADFAAVAGTQEYAKTTIAADFYQVSRLGVMDDGRFKPVSRVNPSEQYTLGPPTSGASMRLYYFPTSPVFVIGTETFDGINGWEEHAIMNAAIYIKAKKEDDTGQFRARKRELEERMAVMANRLRDEPPRVVRRASPTRRGYHIPYATAVRAYDLRGANIELFA